MNENIIIWDWNGTLLNDIDACLKSINNMLRKRAMKPLLKEQYKEVFTFPVQDYYRSIGFDFKDESFDKLSVEYIDLYKEKSKGSQLQPGAIETLGYFENIGYKQVIVSASEQRALEDQVKQQNIADYFESVIGLNNIHAKSKKDNALNYLKNNKQFREVTLIGDTFHDYEVAQAIGSECILVNNGHQNLKRFNLNGGVKIVDNLFKINEFVSCS